MLFLQWNCRLLISLMRLKINRGPHCLLVPTKVFYVSNACHSCVTCFWPMQSLLTYLHRIFSFEKKRILSSMLIFSIKWRPIEFFFPAKLVDWFVFFCILWLLVYSSFTTSQKPQFDDSLLNLSALTVKHISWLLSIGPYFLKASSLIWVSVKLLIMGSFIISRNHFESEQQTHTQSLLKCLLLFEL